MHRRCLVWDKARRTKPSPSSYHDCGCSAEWRCEPHDVCHRLSMRTNCLSALKAGARVVWSGIVFLTMRVLFMTVVSAKAQVAFRPLNPSAPHGPSSRTIGTVSSPLSCLFIPIPCSLTLGQRSSPTLCYSVCPIPLRSVIVSDLSRLRVFGTYPALAATVNVRTSY